MTKKLNLYILLGAGFMILTWLFVGLFRHDEFHEHTLFFKCRPTFKVNFYSPIGMQDLEINDLPYEEKIEEMAFQEFVEKQNQQDNSNPKFWFLPSVLIQLTLTFLTFGVLKSRQTIFYRVWQLSIHFIICIVATAVGFGVILSVFNIFMTTIGGLLIVVFNYCVALLQATQKNKMFQT